MILISLAAVLLMGIPDQPDMERTYFGVKLSHDLLMTLIWSMVRLSIALMVFIALLCIPFTRDLMKRILNAIAGWGSRSGSRFGSFTALFCNFTIKIIDNFHTGLTMVKQPVKLVTGIGLTIVIWATTALSYWIFALGCPGIDLSIAELSTVMVIVCFFTALPSIPGFWGLWEAAGVFALALFGVAEKDALGFTLINHTIQLVPVIATGLISALLTSVNFWQLSRSQQVMDIPGPSHKGVQQ